MTEPEEEPIPPDPLRRSRKNKATAVGLTLATLGMISFQYAAAMGVSITSPHIVLSGIALTVGLGTLVFAVVY